MHIKVIGSGNMWTNNNNASYLIDDDILIDMPNGSLKRLYNLGVDVKKINNICITHFHGDHYFDLPFYLLYKLQNPTLNINIYTPNKGEKIIYKLLDMAFPNTSKIVKKNCNIKISYSCEFKIKEYNVEKVLLKHGMLKLAYGYIFSDGKTKVGFTGDTSYCDAVDYMASKCQHLICDCDGVEGNSQHMGINDIMFLAQKYPQTKFYTSHMSEMSRKKLSELKIKNIIILKDNDKIL